ncbi:MAG: hypothetical protein WKG06_30305 [Segetibacter sp.]
MIAAYEDDEMLGCCMLIQVEFDTVQLRQMAVKAGLQGKRHWQGINAIF